MDHRGVEDRGICPLKCQGKIPVPNKPGLASKVSPKRAWQQRAPRNVRRRAAQLSYKLVSEADGKREPPTITTEAAPNPA